MSTSTDSAAPNEGACTTNTPVPILATSFLLAGLGTVVLGPLLPSLLHDWSLTDQQGGLLLFAKFVGAFTGGATVPTRLRLGILSGHLLAAAGFAGFALSHGLLLALPSLFLTGLGLGEIIASTNILAGRRWPNRAGSALALLNFFWSLGAVSTGVLVAFLLPRFSWRHPLLGLSLLFVLTGAFYTIRRSQLAESEKPSVSPSQSQELQLTLQPLAHRITFIFGGLLFLYGGLETCLTAWLTTFSLRFGGGHLLGGQSGFVILWAALTAGRVLASAVMRRFAERTVQTSSLLLCLVLVLALLQTHSATMLSFTCVLLGLALAPVFPSTFAMLLKYKPASRTAGFLLATSGLGAALFPWLMGAFSTHTGSLRLAMVVPALLIPLMLLLARLDRAQSASFST